MKYAFVHKINGELEYIIEVDRFFKKPRYDNYIMDQVVAGKTKYNCLGGEIFVATVFNKGDYLLEEEEFRKFAEENITLFL